MMTRFRTKMWTLAVATVLALSAGSTAAYADPTADEPTWAAIGQVSNTGACEDGQATFAVHVPTLLVENGSPAGFSVNGVDYGTETLNPGPSEEFSPFDRTVTIDAGELPAEFAVSYWIEDHDSTLFVDSYSFDATCTSTPADADAGTFVSLDPARVLDTRVGNGAPKAPVGAFGTVSLQVTGRGGVPAEGVAAVVVNVTVTGSSTHGFITVYPDGSAQPNASNLNFSAGQSIPNLVTVKVGTGGKIDLTNNSAGSTHLIADVSGYYLAGTPTEAGTFTSLAPARLLDTRVGNGAPQGAVGSFGTVGLQVTGRGGVPETGVSAVVMNVTVTSPTAVGFTTIYPSGGNVPTASSLNFSAGQTIPNLVTVKVGKNGKVNLRNNSAGTADLIADVAGYYLAGTATAPGAFVSLEPQRFLDTRPGSSTSRPAVEPFEPLALLVTNRLGVPSPGAAAVVVNVTVTGPSAVGFITAYPFGNAQPTASNLNFTAGQTIPNLAVVKVGGNGRINLANNSNGTVDLIADVAGYFIAAPDAVNEVWASGWILDECGTQNDGVLLLDAPGLIYRPQGTVVTAGGGEYYHVYLPDNARRVVVTLAAKPGYTLLIEPNDPEWVRNSDGSVTGTIQFTNASCGTRSEPQPGDDLLDLRDGHGVPIPEPTRAA